VRVGIGGGIKKIFKLRAFAVFIRIFKIFLSPLSIVVSGLLDNIRYFPQVGRLRSQDQLR